MNMIKSEFLLNSVWFSDNIFFNFAIIFNYEWDRIGANEGRANVFMLVDCTMSKPAIWFKFVNIIYTILIVVHMIYFFRLIDVQIQNSKLSAELMAEKQRSSERLNRIRNLEKKVEYYKKECSDLKSKLTTDPIAEHLKVI